MTKILEFLKKKYAQWWWDCFMTPGRLVHEMNMADEFRLYGEKMNENKRFESGEGTEGPLIYDNNGVDDYYFINDPEELEKFIDLINSTEDEWKENYNHLLEVYKTQLKFNNEKDMEISRLQRENQLLENSKTRGLPDVEKVIDKHIDYWANHYDLVAVDVLQKVKQDICGDLK